MGDSAMRASPARLAEIERRLAVLDLDEGPALPWLVRSLAEVLETPAAFAYGCADDGETLHCDFLHASWDAGARMFPQLDAVLAKYGATGPGYDPRRPDPKQRNRTLFVEETIGGGTRAHGREVLATAQTREVLLASGILGQDQLRALICDGPSLLAWVGAFSEQDFDEPQRRTFDRLVPAIQRRLALERRLATAAWALPALDAALENTGAAAIVRADGRVVHANAAARAARERDRHGFSTRLDDALHGRGDAFRLVPLAARGAPDHYLAIATPSREEEISARCARAAEAWSLTRRQREVLEQMVLGLPNKTIAAVLAMSDRTVEVHVSSILSKAQQESRASVIARVLSG